MENRENMQQLADLLLTKPVPFSYNTYNFCSRLDASLEDPVEGLVMPAELVKRKQYHDLSGDAMAFAVINGIGKDFHLYTDPPHWFDYVHDTFTDDSCLVEWLFGDVWELYDDTQIGAGIRLRRYLDEGYYKYIGKYDDLTDEVLSYYNWYEAH